MFAHLKGGVRRVRVIAGRRRQSTESELLDSAARWRLIKVAVVGVPTFVIGGLASLAVHSPDNRARIEPILPDFVQFLREKIGFDDEDVVDRNRKSLLEKFYDMDQVIIIRGPTGETVLTKTVPGRMSLPELHRLAREELGGLSLSARIDFQDGSLVPAGDPTEAPGPDLRPNLTLQKSLWNTEESEEGGLSPASEPVNDEYLKLFCMFYPPNMLSNRLQSLRDFQLLPGLKSQEHGQNKSNNNDKMYINETIKRLQSTVRQLENEKRAGSREIDQIDEDLKAVKAKISSLQWKKWSLF